MCGKIPDTEQVMEIIKKFMESIIHSYDIEEELREEIESDMRRFFDECERGELVKLSSLLKYKDISGDREDVFNILLKVDFALHGVMSLFHSINHLIFDALDHFDAVNNKRGDVMEERDFLRFYKENYSLFEVKKDYDCLPDCVDNFRSCVIRYINDSFLEEKMIPDRMFVKFKHDYVCFIRSIFLYYKSCEVGNVYFMTCSLRDVNCHMMFMESFIRDFCLAIGTLWLYL